MIQTRKEFYEATYTIDGILKNPNRPVLTIRTKQPKLKDTEISVIEQDPNESKIFDKMFMSDIGVKSPDLQGSPKHERSNDSKIYKH